MLKKFLSNYGITLEDLKTIFSDYSSLFTTYEELKEKVSAGEDEYAPSLADIEQQIVNALRQSRNEFRILDYVKEHGITAKAEGEEKKEEKKEEQPKKKEKKAKVTAGEEEEEEEPETVIEIPLEEEMVLIEEAPEPAKNQKAILELNNANFGEPYNFLKVLSLLNASYKWKEGKNYIFWDIDKESYLITQGNPLTDKNTFAKRILVVAPDSDRAKAISYLISAKAITIDDSSSRVPSFHEIEGGEWDINMAKDEVKDSFPEPVTKITYSKLDNAVKDLFRLDSLAKLLTLFAIKKISDENAKMSADEFKKTIMYYVETPEPISIKGINEKLIIDAEILKSLKKDGFITDKLTLSDKGGIMMTLHKYCFNYGLHPFAFVYNEPNDIYNSHSPMQYVTLESSKTFYTDGVAVFERGGAHIAKTMYDSATLNEDLNGQLENTLKNTNLVPYKPYAYCLGLYYSKSKSGGETVGEIHATAEKLGVVVMHNYVNRTEFFVSSPLLRYILKNYGTDVVFMAEKDKPSLLYIAKKTGEAVGEFIAMIATIKSGNALGISNYSFSLFDRDGIEEYLRNNNISAYFNGTSYYDFMAQNEDLWVGKTVEDVAENVEEMIEESTEPTSEEIVTEEPVIVEKTEGAVVLPTEEDIAVVVEDGEIVEKFGEDLDQYGRIENKYVDSVIGELADQNIEFSQEKEGSDYTGIRVSETNVSALQLAIANAVAKEEQKEPVTDIKTDEQIAEELMITISDIEEELQVGGGMFYDNYKAQRLLGDKLAPELAKYGKTEFSKEVFSIIEAENYHHLNNAIALLGYYGEKEKDAYIQRWAKNHDAFLNPASFNISGIVVESNMTSNEAEIELNNDIEILKKISASSFSTKAGKVLERISSYKAKGIINEDLADDFTVMVNDISADRGVKVKPSQAKPSKPDIKVKKAVVQKPAPMVKPVMKTTAPKKAKLPSVVSDTPEEFQEVWMETNKMSGKKRDVAIVDGLLKRDVDAVILEDLVAIGFDLEKWIISEVLIRVDNKYDIYKNSYLDRRYFISKA